MDCNINAMLEAVRLLVRPDDATEIRILYAARGGRKVAGFTLGRDFERIARAVGHHSTTAWGVYFTPNPVNPDCLARTNGSLRDVAIRNGAADPPLTSDADVVQQRYLLVDVDPVRATGHEADSATDAERAAGWDVLQAVRKCMSETAWPAPIIVDSGNGYHAYYRIPTSDDPAIVDAVRLALMVLDYNFSTPNAHIDTKIFNPSRIMKLPGTYARKGTPTQDRPHRMAKILEVPSDW
jgi:hypothetical protein